MLTSLTGIALLTDLTNQTLLTQAEELLSTAFNIISNLFQPRQAYLVSSDLSCQDQQIEVPVS